MAAVLACGDGAVLSHRDAGWLLGLLPAPAGPPEVTVARSSKGISGVRVHRTKHLPPDHVTVRDGIPCTTVARTLVDLAAVVTPRQLERAVGQAETLKIFDRREVEAVLATRPRARGTRELRRLLGRSDAHTTLTRSPAEDRFFAFCERAGLPRPELNVPFVLPDGTEIKIDALWRQARLAIEVDSATYHGTPRVMASDRRRDAQLTLAGYRPVRFLEDDFTGRKRATRTAEILRELIGAR